jgi:hypothetical protein
MKPTLIALAAAGALSVALPAAAQSWAPIDARQAMLETRIDQGLRNRSLTQGEAMRLRAEFRDIATLEGRYRATGGLQNWERQDLDQRFDRLSAQIRMERADGQVRGGNGYGANAPGAWQSVQQRQANLDRRIDVGLRNGTLTRREAQRLRNEFRDIAAVEARYRVNGLNPAERADLDRRFDRLSAMIRVERADNQYR